MRNLDKGHTRYGYRPVIEDIGDFLKESEDDDEDQQQNNDQQQKDQNNTIASPNSPKSTSFGNYLQYINHLVSKNLKEVREDWLEVEFLRFKTHRNQIEILDPENKIVTIEEFKKEYTKNVNLIRRSKNANFNNSSNDTPDKEKDNEINGSEQYKKLPKSTNFGQFGHIDNESDSEFESNITDTKCDLGILYHRCEANGIENIISRSKYGKRTFYRLDGLKHIDLYEVYRKPLVKTGIFHDIYRTLKLDEVSKVFLGYGKYNDLSGKDFLNLSIEDQRQYSLRDSELVMDLSKHNNYEVLDALNGISEITGLDLQTVCKTDLGRWWSTLFNDMIENNECSKNQIMNLTEQKKQNIVVL